MRVFVKGEKTFVVTREQFGELFQLLNSEEREKVPRV